MRYDPRQLGPLAAWVLLLAALIAPGGALAQQEDAADPRRVAAVKAGMVINFMRYTTWPDSCFEDGEEMAPIIVTVVGDTRLSGALVAAAEGQRVGGRGIEIRRLEDPRSAEGEPTEGEMEEFHAALRGSHVVYFGGSEEDRYGETLDAMADCRALTVSDIEGFAEEGGMLGLTLAGRRMAFEANEDAIREAELRVSSQVLRLAREVHRLKPRREEDDDGGER